MKAQKKPVIIDYFPIITDYLQSQKGGIEEAIQKWMDEFNEKFNDHFIWTPIVNDEDGTLQLEVKTLEGTSYPVDMSQVIIRGIKGEYYPCRKDIFDDTYDKI